MKIVAFNGSPRPDGNTAAMLGIVFEELKAEGADCELVQLGGRPVRGCVACYKCFERKNNACAMREDDDFINKCILKIMGSDAVLLGSPTYFSDVSSEMKTLIDRAGLVAMANGSFFKRKLGAAVVAVRRGGAIHTFDTMNHFFLISQMIVPGSCYWNMGVGREKGQVLDDEEGVRTMRLLGQNMAWLLKKIKA
jgi:multimeric flavodoxin WrbA